LLAVLVIVAVVAGAFAWSSRHPPEACACGPQISFGLAQPGFERIGGPVATGLTHLPVHLRIAPVIGVPAGVYRGGGFALVLYGHRSRFGVFRFTAQRSPSGFGHRSLDALARECAVCSGNRLVALAPGVRGAVLAGGNGPNSVTWLQNGLEMVVLGPASNFSDARAVAAARALARANEA
jgi:hypothetical protein